MKGQENISKRWVRDKNIPSPGKAHGMHNCDTSGSEKGGGGRGGMVNKQ